MSRWSGNLALLLCSVIISMLAGEVAYRAWLYYRVPGQFIQNALSQNPSSTFAAYSRSFATFDERYGFDYVPNLDVLWTSIDHGRVAGCGMAHVNEHGSWGRVERDYQQARAKILVVGDSFTARAENGETWVTMFEDLLAAKLGEPVSVVNLARDGQGVLQMLDIAAGEVERRRPDLILAAYITDDLTRQRIWRRVERVDGRDRLFTTTSDDPRFDLARAVDTLVIAPDQNITLPWCTKSPPPDRTTDPIVRELEERFRIAVRHAATRADLFTLRSSYLFGRLKDRDAFAQFNPDAERVPVTNPRHRLGDYREDERTRANIEQLKKSGVPVVPVHLSTRSEIRAKTEFQFPINPAREAGLVRSLEQALGTGSILVQEQIEGALDVEALGASARDDHPSLVGMRLYATSALRGLEKAGRLPGQHAAADAHRRVRSYGESPGSSAAALN